MVSGSVASIYYGEPRLTNDVGIVLWLTPDKVDSLIDSFPPEKFYCPPREVICGEMERDERGHCNLIHHATGFKADLYFVKNDPSTSRDSPMFKREKSTRFSSTSRRPSTSSCGNSSSIASGNQRNTSATSAA